MNLRRLILAVGLAAASAACAFGADAPAGQGARTASAPTTGPSAAPLRVGAGDTEPRKVDPRDDGLELGFGEFAITLEAEEIRPGPVTFVIRNGGRLVHGFEIQIEEENDGNSGHGNSDDGLKLEGPTFGPGETVRLSADLAPGIYEIECFVAEHDDMGMRAMLVVRPDAPLVPAEPATRTDRVEVSDFAFAPEQIELHVGAELTWLNADPTAHTVTAGDGSFDSGPLKAGDLFRTSFTEPGTYDYFCRIHPTMRGSVRVTPSG
jgi:plastocyanin